MSLTVNLLAGFWVAEIADIGDLGAIGASEASAMIDVLLEHHVVVVRDQQLSPRRQHAVCDVLGRAVEPWDRHNVAADERYVQIFHGRSRPYRRPTEYWHTDGSFMEQPTMATMLHGVSIPPEGGDTWFANARAAHDALSPSRQRAIDGRVARHSFSHQFRKLRARRDGRDDPDEAARFPDVVHPLVLRHPITTRPAIYLNELNLVDVVGSDAAESEALLAGLYAHVLDDPFTYRHRWRRGDVLIWDNPSVLHRATPVRAGAERIVHRTTFRYHPSAATGEAG